MRKMIVLVLLFLSVSVCSFCFCLILGKKTLIDNEQKLSKRTKTDYKNFHYAQYNDKEFYGNLENLVSGDEIISEKVYGGIVSHHLAVAPEIVRFFKNLEQQNPETILLLGPNHFGSGSNVFVSRYPYETPWGIVEPDMENIDKLLKSGLVDNQEAPFEKEHSISGLVSYIKYVFPDAKIIPIIFTRHINQDRIELLSGKLLEILPDSALAIASVDFSHHLNRFAAQFHDEESISTIKNFDFNNISNLEIDSPASIYVLLRYLEGREARNMEYIYSTNSANFLKNLDIEDVTSYVFSYFIKGPVSTGEGISFLSFGDAMFDRGVENIILKNKNPFEYIKGIEGNFLKGLDFITLNLEGPITDYNSCGAKELSFKFDPSIAELLSENSFNMINLANNHIFDCFNRGIEDTKKYLKEFGIDYFGESDLENSYTVKKAGDKNIVFLGIDNTLKLIDSALYTLTEKLKEKNDYVVVNIHWGYEYNNLPSKKQEDIAHKLIDSGADVIIGHHPHVVQPMEIYKNKIIFYSLGNFIFDQLTKETNEGIGVGAVLNDNQYNFYIFPYEIVKSQPILLSYDKTVSFCESFLKDVDYQDDCQFSINQ